MSLYSKSSDTQKRVMRENRELQKKYRIKDLTRPEGAGFREILKQVFTAYILLHMIYFALKSFLW